MYISKDLCRICLNSPGAVSIYDKGAEITIIEAIESITKVHILCNDNLPNSICISCLDNINSGLKLCEDVKFAEEHLKQLQTDSEPTIIIDTDDDENSTLNLFDNVEVSVENLSPSCNGGRYIPFYGEEEDASALLSPGYINAESEINNGSEQTDIIEIETDDEKDGKLNRTRTGNKQTIITANGRNAAVKRGKDVLVGSQTIKESVAGVSDNKLFSKKRKNNRMNYYNRKKTTKKESKTNRNGENNSRGPSREKLHTCNICFEQFLNRKYLLNHKTCHTNDNKYTCEVCNNTYNTKSSLKWHMHLSHGPSPRIRCRQCSKIFPNKYSLQNHLDFQCVKKHICDTCGKGFYRVDNMKVHIRTVHLKQKNFICIECGKAFGVSSNLRSHIRNVHYKQSTSCSFD